MPYVLAALLILSKGVQLNYEKSFYLLLILIAVMILELSH
jgi:hypothetical protein